MSLAPVQAADALLNELTPAVPREHAPSMTQIKKVSYTHSAMVDLIIEKPTITQNEIAATFGYSVPWVSHIFASDSFQAYLASRKDELIDPTLRATIKERFDALVRQSIDVLMEKLNKPAAAISDNLALRAAELGARSLGLGRTDAPPPAPQGDRLTILAQRLVILQGDVRKGNQIEGEATRIPGEDPSDV